jgi:hypothetical protein
VQFSLLKQTKTIQSNQTTIIKAKKSQSIPTIKAKQSKQNKKEP